MSQSSGTAHDSSGSSGSIAGGDQHAASPRTFAPGSASKALLEKYCTTFAGNSVCASALAVVTAVLALDRTDGAAADAQQQQQQVYLCPLAEDSSGSDASTASSQRSSGTGADRTPPVPMTTLPDSWFTAPATESASAATTHPHAAARNAQTVYTFAFCVLDPAANTFRVFEAKIIPVGQNILLAATATHPPQSRLSDIATFQAPSIGAFAREPSHRRHRVSTTPYTPESIELYAGVLAHLGATSPFASSVAPPTPPHGHATAASTPHGPSPDRPPLPTAASPPVSAPTSFGSLQPSVPRLGENDLRPPLPSMPGGPVAGLPSGGGMLMGPHNPIFTGGQGQGPVFGGGLRDPAGPYARYDPLMPGGGRPEFGPGPRNTFPGEPDPDHLPPFWPGPTGPRGGFGAPGTRRPPFGGGGPGAHWH